MHHDKEPEAVYIDGWAYYPRPVNTPLVVPPKRKRTKTIVLSLAAATVTLATATIAVVLVTIAESSTRTDADAIQIEQTMRRFLAITSSDDPAFTEYACNAFREKYQGRRRTDVTVYQPVVERVDRIRVDGLSAVAVVHVTIHGTPESKEFKLRKEDGRWKACTLAD